MFVGYLFLQFKDGREIHQINPLQILMNLQYYDSFSLIFFCVGIVYCSFL